MESLINSNTEENTIEQQIFYNYLILKNIFEHLEHSSLKEARQACTFWNEIASTILYSKSYALLNDSDKLNDFVLNLIDKDEHVSKTKNAIGHIKIGDIYFIEADLKNLELLLCCSITDTLVCFEIDFAPCHGKFLLDTLLNGKIFPQLEKLKIRILKFYDVFIEENENDDIYRIKTSGIQDGKNECNFPKLRSFTYIYYSFDGSDFGFPIKWEYLLGQFYNLQELLFTGISSAELHEVLDAVWVLREANPCHFNIETFQILSEDLMPEAPDNTHLLKLIQLHLPLKALRLEISAKIDEFILESALSCYEHSLQQLQLRKYPNPIYTIQQPIVLTSSIFNGLSNLLSLDVSDNFFPSLDFLVQLPDLAKLTLSNRNSSKLSQTKMIQNTSTELFAGGHQLCYQLTSLNIEQNISTKCLKRICTLFPNLEHLKLRVDDEMLRIIYGHLTQLKSLYIIGKFPDDDDEDERDNAHDHAGENTLANKTTCSDKGITGIPLRYMVWGNVNIKKNRMFPYIGYLSNLEKLTIESWTNYGIGISNYSIYYGLIELSKLKEVKFIRTLVTEEGIDVLQAKGVKVQAFD